MKKINEYTTIRESNFEDFDKKVNKLIKEGFQPFGNPYVTDIGEFLACQAMVRYEE